MASNELTDIQSVTFAYIKNLQNLTGEPIVIAQVARYFEVSPAVIRERLHAMNRKGYATKTKRGNQNAWRVHDRKENQNAN